MLEELDGKELRLAFDGLYAALWLDVAINPSHWPAFLHCQLCKRGGLNEWRRAQRPETTIPEIDLIVLLDQSL